MDTRKIILVTGANTGLGYETVKALCASAVPYDILVGSRSPAKAEPTIKALNAEYPETQGHLRSIQIDLEDDDSIASAFKFVSDAYGKLDVLVNNSGAQLDHVPAMTTRQMWNKTFDINVTGTHIMTQTFAPLLLKSADPRVLFITSGMSSLDGADDFAMPWNKVPSKGWPKPPSLTAYRCSKTALNMLMREWHRFFQEDGVKVWCVSPGYLATGLGVGKEQNLKQGAIDPSIGGRFVKDVVEGKRDGDAGKVVHFKGHVQPW